MAHTFTPVNLRESVNDRENAILAKWDAEKTFEKSLKKTKNEKPYVFYDGPPFATGTPHYGHIVASVMKDAVPRYWTMRGYFVDRKWGWDCHGLPIENIVEKELGSKSKKDIEAIGIEKFNDLCRSNVLGYVDEWRRVIRRIGRWADMDDAYKTMDPEFMESVWWVFKELWDKGLISEGYRSMHICPRCETTLSQQEVSEGYMNVKDISVTAKFELADEPGTFVLAWTTTPWTLPGNVALAIGEAVSYAVVTVSGEDVRYIVALPRVEAVFSGKEYSIERKFSGKELVGKSYKPVFNYYASDLSLKNRNQGWKIYAADFVTTEEGTGVVHIAPAFGEDDMRLGKEYNLPFIQHVGMDGVMRAEMGEFSGMQVKPKDDPSKTDVEILKYLASKRLLFAKSKYEHSYPHCWRCDTPLLNYATSSLFVKVESLKDRLIETAKPVQWMPEHIKEGRFGKWLIGARDWSISRQRFWASVVPVWKCEQCKNVRVVGSIAEIGEHFGNPNLVFLVRHGEGEQNVLGILNSLQEKEKYSLTENGKNQAQHAAETLRKEGIFAVYHSPLRRARETAAIIADTLHIPMIEDERLRETDFGYFHGKTEKEIGMKYPDSTSRMHPDPRDAMESFEEVKLRVESFVRDIHEQHQSKKIAVVSHADTLRIVRGVMKGVSLEESVSGWYPDFASVKTVYSKPVDIHRPYIDSVTFACDCGGIMKRVPDVLDTWFDSGSMPYAQKHYPFENQESFEKGFPAQFIAEGIDQTRAWFYYVHVIGTAIQESNAFQNVIVNGIVLAEDGKKMSKKLKNYPDPMHVLEKYGADVLRMYLLSSPVVSAENLNFSEKEMKELSGGMFRMIRNSYAFFMMYASIDRWLPQEHSEKPVSVLDRWILSELQNVVREVHAAMERYDLSKATRLFAPFADDLSNWYVRRSRKRFWKSEDDADKNFAYQTLYTVLLELAKLMAPFAPFIAEEMYAGLTGLESVHLESYPERRDVLIEEKLFEKMSSLREVITLGLQKRAEYAIKVRQPLSRVFVSRKYADAFGEVLERDSEWHAILCEELNVKDVEVGLSETVDVDKVITPELEREGRAREIIRVIQDGRKKAGFQISDRVVISYHGQDDIFSDETLERMIAKETLAKKISSDAMEQSEYSEESDIDGLAFSFSLKRVQ